MQQDGDGFIYPIKDDVKCVGCGLCINCCPLKNRDAQIAAEQNNPHIKIVNLHNTYNYGAVIAAACLEKKVRETVSPYISVQTVTYSHIIPKSQFLDHHRDAAGDMQSWKKYIDHKFFPVYPTTEEKAVIAERKRKFVLFSAQFLNATVSYNNKALDNICDNDVAYICGSDVIWQPKRARSVRAKAYFLDFGKKDAVRIAYAPAVDAPVDFRLRRLKKLYRNYLSGIDYISVRETSSAAFLSKLTGKTITVCADPVLLCSAGDFDEMISLLETDEKYIYAYLLDENAAVSEYCKKLSEEKNMKIYYYANKPRDLGNNAVFCGADGPSEFLGRVKKAEYVITTSFHCTVFSVLFGKKFVAFERNFNNKLRSIKTQDFLSQVGLADRIAYDTVPDIDEIPDFAKASEKLEEMRKVSADFLTEALSSLK